MATTETLLASSTTSEDGLKTPTRCEAGRPITKEEGKKIVAEAAKWAGTPYSKIGKDSVQQVGGDCSGSTFKIYRAAGFPYTYQSTGAFLRYVDQTHRFVEVTDGMQAGDVLWWPGHVAIFAEFDENDANRVTTHTGTRGTFKTQNNIWTATHPGGDPYQPYDYKKFRPGEPPRVFRYFLHKGEPGC